MAERPSFFQNDEPDLSDFSVQKTKPVLPPEIVRDMSEKAGFQSREPKPSRTTKKADNRYRTGRNILLSAKINKRTNELLYGIHGEHRDNDGNPTMTIGEILERALELYRRELDNQKLSS
jgi:hypothetical protein